jgi:hypothetical protein
MQSLPNEIVLEISKYLEGIDLGRFSMVNKKLYELLEPKRKIEKYDFIRGCNMSTSKFLDCYCRLWLNKKRFIRCDDPLPDYVSIDPEFIFHCLRCNAKVDGLAYLKKTKPGMEASNILYQKAKE